MEIAISLPRRCDYLGGLDLRRPRGEVFLGVQIPNDLASADVQHVQLVALEE